MGIGRKFKGFIRKAAPIIAVAAPFIGPALGASAMASRGIGIAASLAQKRKPMSMFTGSSFPGGGLDQLGGGGIDYGGLAGGIINLLGQREQRRGFQTMAAAPMGSAVLRRYTPAGGSLMASVVGGAGVVRNAAGRILRVVMAGGRSISRQKAVALAKRVGIDAAAVALGISAVELAQMMIDAPKSRRRGLSWRNLSTARRVCRTISTMAKSLAECAPRARAGRRLPSHGHRVVPT